MHTTTINCPSCGKQSQVALAPCYDGPVYCPLCGAKGGERKVETVQEAARRGFYGAKVPPAPGSES